MRCHLRKGVPSLGSDLASIFESDRYSAREQKAGALGEKLGKPAPPITDACDLRKHPIQQMIMNITKRCVVVSLHIIDRTVLE